MMVTRFDVRYLYSDQMNVNQDIYIVHKQCIRAFRPLAYKTSLFSQLNNSLYLSLNKYSSAIDISIKLRRIKTVKGLIQSVA